METTPPTPQTIVMEKHRVAFPKLLACYGKNASPDVFPLPFTQGGHGHDYHGNWFLGATLWP